MVIVTVKVVVSPFVPVAVLVVVNRMVWAVPVRVQGEARVHWVELLEPILVVTPVRVFEDIFAVRS
jgi:hypothetical protein